MAILDKREVVVRTPIVSKSLKAMSEGETQKGDEPTRKCLTQTEVGSLYDSLSKISADDDYKSCFCERIGEGDFVCGWEPKHKKSLLRVFEKDSKKSGSSSTYGISVISANWNSSKGHTPGLRPWTNKSKGEPDSGDAEYAFEHLKSAKEYIEDYRKKHTIGGGSPRGALGSGDTPDPYVNKLKHCGDLLDRLRRYTILEHGRKSERVLTPTVMRNKHGNQVHIDLVNAAKHPIDGIQSLSLGLSSRRSARSNPTAAHKHQTSQHTPNLTGRRCNTAPSPTSSGSSDDCREASRYDRLEETSQASLTGHHPSPTTDRLTKARLQQQTRAVQNTEANLPIAEIHFSETSGVKGKTWTSGSGQYMNLSFPKTAVPLPVRVALTPDGYSADGRGSETPTRAKNRDSPRVNLTPTRRATRGRCATPRGLYTEKGSRSNSVTRRKVQSDSVTNCGGSLAKKLSGKSNLGTMNPKVPT